MGMFTSRGDAQKAAAGARASAEQNRERAVKLAREGDRFGAYIAAGNARLSEGWAANVADRAAENLGDGDS